MTDPFDKMLASQQTELLQEELTVDTRERETGRVVIETKVETTQQVVEAILKQDEVSVVRVPIGRVVRERPSIREEGDLLIIPVIEEQLFVETRLVLKEELHVTRRSHEALVRKTVPVRSERADVFRREAADQPESNKALNPENER